jgi:hypothetical protein
VCKRSHNCLKTSREALDFGGAVVMYLEVAGAKNVGRSDA